MVAGKADLREEVIECETPDGDRFMKAQIIRILEKGEKPSTDLVEVKNIESGEVFQWDSYLCYFDDNPIEWDQRYHALRAEVVAE